ncbi:MAG: hypothetical protein Q7K28_01655 [Candidatus Wildermuthbacteria bacterium]|nr:hypothetical protein [Candidatus Wildermuthbacteria bacterium]
MEKLTAEFLKIEKGISVVEILVAIAILGIALTSLSALSSFSLKENMLTGETAQANSLAQETIEAARNFRDGTVWTTNGLGTLNVGAGNPYYPKKSGAPSVWTLAAGVEQSGIFTRKIIFDRVFRDANYNISSSGTEDLNTRKVRAFVSWKDKKMELTTYLTNWRQ